MPKAQAIQINWRYVLHQFMYRFTINLTVGVSGNKQMQLQPVCLSVAVQRNFFSRITSVQQSRFVSGLSRLPCAAITIHFIVSLSTLQLGAEEAVHEVCVSKTTDPIIVTSSKDGVCIHSTPAAQMVVSGHASQWTVPLSGLSVNKTSSSPFAINLTVW